MCRFKSLFWSAVLAGIFVHVSIATVIDVPGVQPTIQAGIIAASDGDTVLVAPGTYYENVNFEGRKITLASEFILAGDESKVSSTVIDANASGAAVTFDNREDTLAKIIGFTIQNAAQRGIECYNGFPIIQHNIVQNNQGGGINIDGDSTGFAVIRNNVVRGNTTQWEGGGICYAGGDAPGIVTGNAISYNSADYGGAIYAVGEVDVTGNTMTANTSSRGGGIYCYYASVDLSGCTIDSSNGSGVVAHRSFIAASDMQVIANSGQGASGFASPMNFTGCDFLDNGTRGIISTEAAINVVGCLFSGNQGGGFIAYDTGFIHIESSVFDSNTTAQMGGAIALWNYNETTYGEILDCTFSSNVAAYGGAIALNDAVVDVSGCLLEGNSATGSMDFTPEGGAIAAFMRCTVTVANSTIVNNVVMPELPWTPEYGNGGGINLVQSSLSMTHTILAGNQATNGSAIRCDASSVEFTDCNVYGHEGGDYIGCLAGLLGSDGNFTADPLFCDEANGVFELAANSRCAAANSPSGLLVGAFDIGCSALSCCGRYDPENRSGNVDHDSQCVRDLTDILWLASYAFLGGAEPPCLAEGNVDGDAGCVYDLSDILGLASFAFMGGAQPAYCMSACE